MNKKKIGKLIQRTPIIQSIPPLLNVFLPPLSHCQNCGIPWSFLDAKSIPYTDDIGVKIICTHCWDKLDFSDILRIHIDVCDLNNLKLPFTERKGNIPQYFSQLLKDIHLQYFLKEKRLRKSLDKHLSKGHALNWYFDTDIKDMMYRGRQVRVPQVSFRDRESNESYVDLILATYNYSATIIKYYEDVEQERKANKEKQG